MSNAIRVESLSKLYRRMAPGFQLRTLKSALLERSLTEGLTPEEMSSFIEDHLRGNVCVDDLKLLAGQMEQASLEGYGSDNLTVGLAYVCPGNRGAELI